MQSATLSCGEPLALWYDLVRDGAHHPSSKTHPYALTTLPELVHLLVRHGEGVCGPAEVAHERTAQRGHHLVVGRIAAQGTDGSTRASPPAATVWTSGAL